MTPFYSSVSAQPKQDAKAGDADMTRSILIMAGGTGGHILSSADIAFALAENVSGREQIYG